MDGCAFPFLVIPPPTPPPSPAVSAPLVFPAFFGNFHIMDGTLRASAAFPPSAYLVQVRAGRGETRKGICGEWGWEGVVGHASPPPHRAAHMVRGGCCCVHWCSFALVNALPSPSPPPPVKIGDSAVCTNGDNTCNINVGRSTVRAEGWAPRLFGCPRTPPPAHTFPPFYGMQRWRFLGLGGGVTETARRSACSPTGCIFTSWPAS